MSSRTSSAGTGARGRAVPVTMTLLSISSVQLSDAFSLPMIEAVGASGTAWLRAGVGALLLLVVVRPRFRALGAPQWRAIVTLGVLSAALSLSFLAALERLPLGTAVAIEFLGPLGVAVAGAGRAGALWPVMALVGVVALSEPWTGSTSAVGVLLALVSAASWAGCILATSRVGDRVAGLDGVALATPVAALCLAPFGAVQALAHLDLTTVAQGITLAVLMPVVPYVLELLALRRLAQGTFATLMSLEPALAAVVGVVVLGQGLSWLSDLGVLLVVGAGVGATRTASGNPVTDRREARLLPSAVPPMTSPA